MPRASPTLLPRCRWLPRPPHRTLAPVSVLLSVLVLLSVSVLVLVLPLVLPLVLVLPLASVPAALQLPALPPASVLLLALRRHLHQCLQTTPPTWYVGTSRQHGAVVIDCDVACTTTMCVLRPWLGMRSS
jgi:hypothetical protein